MLRGIALRVMLCAGVLGVAAAAARPLAHAGPTRSTAPSKCISTGAVHGKKFVFGELRALNVRVWSGSLSWAAAAPKRPVDPTSPTDPAYRWPAQLDRSLVLARAAKIEPVLAVRDFPSWANGGRGSAWAPQNPKDFADFMAAAVMRYPQVRRWILISEPGNFYNFRPQGGHGRTAPRLYARLLDAAYGAMHAARPNVIVIGGGVHPYGLNDQYTTAPDTFISNMVLPNGRRPRLDEFAVNPYTERPLKLGLRKRAHRLDLDDLDWLGHRLDQVWPRSHLKIFVDEIGWNTEHEALGWLYYVSRKKQSSLMRQAYALAARDGRVDTMCSYLLYDDSPHRNKAQWLNWTSGLRTYRGLRKPGWYAFRKIPAGPRRA